MNFIQISPYMVVVSHKQNEKVHMIDASKMCMVQRRNNILRGSDMDEILTMLKKNEETVHQKMTDYRDMIVLGNMKPQFYLTEEPFAKGMTCFGDIMEKVKRGKLFSAKTLDEISANEKEPGKVQYLTHSNLKDRLIEDNLISLENPDEKDFAYAVEPGDLILSKIGGPFKIAIQEQDDTRTLIASGNLFIVSLKKNLADPYYIKAFLESEKGQSMLNRIANGSVMPNLSLDALKNMKISLPALDVQHEIGEKYHEELKNCIRLKRELAESMNSLNEISNQ